MHVNVTGVDPADDAVDDAVLGWWWNGAARISAEHGIGHAKKPWLHLMRSAEELAAMRAIKQALDPAGILNPNVLLPDCPCSSSARRSASRSSCQVPSAPRSDRRRMPTGRKPTFS